MHACLAGVFSRLFVLLSLCDEVTCCLHVLRIFFFSILPRFDASIFIRRSVDVVYLDYLFTTLAYWSPTIRSLFLLVRTGYRDEPPRTDLERLRPGARLPHRSRGVQVQGDHPEDGQAFG